MLKRSQMDNLKFSQCSMKLLSLPVPQSDFVGVEYLLFTYFYITDNTTISVQKSKLMEKR